MEKGLENAYIEILRCELVPAMGCTEPIAVALASAITRRILGEMPERMEAVCSGNIIKNVMGVKVPNSDGNKGIALAAALGCVAGDDSAAMEVIAHVTEEEKALAKKLAAEGFCALDIAEGVEKLYICIKMYAGEHSAQVIVKDQHTNTVYIEKDGAVLYKKDEAAAEQESIAGLLTLDRILAFARSTSLEEMRDILARQVECNSAIAAEGIKNPYGAQVGRTILSMGDSVEYRAKAAAAAGSDARMGGCAMPVVINSGSGNQGMTVSLPVIEYAKELRSSEDELYRALLISNLTAIHLKEYIGSLSAYCGVVSAACGAGAGIAYLYGGTDEQIKNTVVNTCATASGIVCDGANASCASKIAAALDSAILGMNMARRGLCLQTGDGIVQPTAEGTIRAVGYVGRVGMAKTDDEVLKIMLGKAEF